MIKASSFLLLCCLFLLCKPSLTAEEDKPTMVVEIFRHGARAPSKLKYDPSWKYPGELTPTGMRQQYVLGNIMSQRYPHLLSSYSPVNIFIRSSNMNRTIMSASSQMFGVFETKGPSLSPEVNKDLTLPPFDDKVLIDEIASELVDTLESVPDGFQPLVIQVEKTPADTMLFVGPWNCPQTDIWQAKRLKDSYNEEIMSYVQDSVNHLNGLGYNIKSLTDLHNFGDTLIDNHYDNRKLPEGIEYASSVYNDSVFAFKWYSNYNYVGTGVERVLKVLNLLDQISEWFNGAAKGTNPLKFAFLSAHDTTLLPLLGLYNITNPQCLFENHKSEKIGQEVPYPDCVYPMFASQIIYELYNKTDGPYIKFLYNGKPFKICSNSNEQYDCSLADFTAESRRLLLNYTSKDYQSLCYPEETVQNNEQDKENNNGVSLWILGLIVIMGVAIGVLTFLLISERKQRNLESKTEGFYQELNVKPDTELKELVISRGSTSKGM